MKRLPSSSSASSVIFWPLTANSSVPATFSYAISPRTLAIGIVAPFSVGTNFAGTLNSAFGSNHTRPAKFLRRGDSRSAARTTTLPSSRLTNCSDRRPDVTHSSREAPVTRSRAVNSTLSSDSLVTVRIFCPLASSRRARSALTTTTPRCAGASPLGSTILLSGAEPIV